MWVGKFGTFELRILTHGELRKRTLASSSKYFPGPGKATMRRIEWIEVDSWRAEEFTEPVYLEVRIPVKLSLLKETYMTTSSIAPADPTTPAPSATFDQIADLERKYLLQTYNRYPVVLTRGKGVFLYDIDEKRYLDFVSGLGVNALGHAHPRIVKAIREQAAKLIHVSNLYYHEYQGPLAEKLCTLAGLESGRSSRIAGPRRSKGRSSWHGWRDIAREERRRAGWWRWKGRITGARLGRCR